MKKLYNWLILSLYSHYRKREPKSEEWYFNFLTTSYTAVALLPVLYSVYLIFQYFNILPNIPNKWYFISLFLIFWFINYHFVSKAKLSEKYVEPATNKNIFIVILLFFVSSLIFALVVNLTK